MNSQQPKQTSDDWLCLCLSRPPSCYLVPWRESERRMAFGCLPWGLPFFPKPAERSGREGTHLRVSAQTRPVSNAAISFDSSDLSTTTWPAARRRRPASPFVAISARTSCSNPHALEPQRSGQTGEAKTEDRRRNPRPADDSSGRTGQTQRSKLSAC